MRRRQYEKTMIRQTRMRRHETRYDPSQWGEDNTTTQYERTIRRDTIPRNEEETILQNSTRRRWDDETRDDLSRWGGHNVGRKYEKTMRRSLAMRRRQYKKMLRWTNNVTIWKDTGNKEKMYDASFQSEKGGEGFIPEVPKGKGAKTIRTMYPDKITTFEINPRSNHMSYWSIVTPPRVKSSIEFRVLHPKW